jgi:hypothetical protein
MIMMFMRPTVPDTRYRINEQFTPLLVAVWLGGRRRAAYLLGLQINAILSE